jgi:shikimate dehydrogenase
VISYLSGLDEKTADIQAVNVVKKMPDGTWKGYNSDYFGFLSTLALFGNRDFWKGKKAIIFGTGGSSKAVQVALNDIGVFWQSVSRTGTDNFLSYESIENSILESASLLVNCTPLGMFPNVENCVPIQFEMLGSKHIVIDLVYNPTETLFMQRAAAKGAKVCNGLHMLKAQAEKAWEIWQSQD